MERLKEEGRGGWERKRLNEGVKARRQRGDEKEASEASKATEYQVRVSEILFRRWREDGKRGRMERPKQTGEATNSADRAD